MSDPVIEKLEPATRIVYGRPEVVETQLNRVGDTYACTGLFYYVVDNHLEVAATLIHTREIRKAQLAGLQMHGNQRR